MADEIGRAVTHFYRIHSARYLDHRRIIEMRREALGIDRGGSHDKLEIGAAGQQLLEIAEQKIDIQAALMRLIDDERIVGRSRGSPWVSASRMPSVMSLT